MFDADQDIRCLRGSINSVPVSYTHLDVYKRQLMYDTMVNVGSCACDMVILQDCSHNMCLDAPSRIVASFFDHAVV